MSEQDKTDSMETFFFDLLDFERKAIQKSIEDASRRLIEAYSTEAARVGIQSPRLPDLGMVAAHFSGAVVRAALSDVADGENTKIVSAIGAIIKPIGTALNERGLDLIAHLKTANTAEEASQQTDSAPTPQHEACGECPACKAIGARKGGEASGLSPEKAAALQKATQIIRDGAHDFLRLAQHAIAPVMAADAASAASLAVSFMPKAVANRAWEESASNLTMWTKESARLYVVQQIQNYTQVLQATIKDSIIGAISDIATDSPSGGSEGFN